MSKDRVVTTRAHLRKLQTMSIAYQSKIDEMAEKCDNTLTILENVVDFCEKNMTKEQVDDLEEMIVDLSKKLND